MIGYYVHHQGRGHLHRAEALQASWSGTVTGLSSLPRPLGWRGPWVRLPRDDRAVAPVDPTARGQWHWAPLGDPGVRARAALLSTWLEQARPAAVLVDVSAEATMLVRLHGVPVVSMVLPGRRTDPVHLAGFRASSALVAAWPQGLDLTPGLPDDVRRRIVCLGGISRYAGTAAPARPSGRRAVLLQGRGGDALWPRSPTELQRRTPGWSWTVLGGSAPWVADPAAAVTGARVVVTTAGQGSLADVAALRRPAVVVACERPFAEQESTAAALRDGPWPVVVASDVEEATDPSTLDRAAALDGDRWAGWCSRGAAEVLRRVLEEVAR
ncbi:MAG: hypothetical protein JOZ82_10430 [Marmoricola sp.]|nr:hypothetical protein [Marmoricola sp.]